MARRLTWAARQRVQEDRLKRLELYKNVQSDEPLASEIATAGLMNLQRAYTREVQQATAQDKSSLPSWGAALLDCDDDSEDSSAHDMEEDPDGVADVRIASESLRSVKLTGAASLKDGSHVVAAAGCGRGVPPSAKVSQCAFVNRGKGRAPMVVTMATDGANLLWAPSSEWQQLGLVPFVSVSSRFAGDPCSRSTIRKRFARGSLRDNYSQVQISEFLQTTLEDKAHCTKPAQSSTAPARKAAQSSIAPARKVKDRRKRGMVCEREAKIAQASHLDPEREKTMSRLMATTVMHEIDLDVLKRANAVLKDERLQIVRDTTVTGTKVPDTPRQVIDVVRGLRASPAPGSPISSSSPQAPAATSEVDLTTKRLPPSSLQAAALVRQSLHLTCIATHPELPRFVAGIGDGQLAVYQLYRAHGEREPQLHQTQGFDASRQCGDLVTALHVPAEPLAQEGALGQESFIAGFESGRVAVFQIVTRADMPPTGSAAAAQAAERPSLLDLVMQRGTHEPTLLPKEPLLLDLEADREAHEPVVSILWHHGIGIISISAHGMVTAADIMMKGAKIWRITCAGGLNASVCTVDLSMRLEQLAVAGQRGVVHLWQCLTQTQAGTLDPSDVLRSPVLLVRYMRSHASLVSVHESGGTVLIWDVLRLELQQVLQTPDCLRATCASWNSQECMLLVFGPKGVVERNLVERIGVGERRRGQSAHSKSARGSRISHNQAL